MSDFLMLRASEKANFVLVATIFYPTVALHQTIYCRTGNTESVIGAIIGHRHNTAMGCFLVQSFPGAVLLVQSFPGAVLLVQSFPGAVHLVQSFPGAVLLQTAHFTCSSDVGG